VQPLLLAIQSSFKEPTVYLPDTAHSPHAHEYHSPNEVEAAVDGHHVWLHAHDNLSALVRQAHCPEGQGVEGHRGQQVVHRVLRLLQGARSSSRLA
jgi:hypothetical protein